MRKSILNFLVSFAASFAFLFGFASCGTNTASVFGGPQVSLEDAIKNADSGDSIDIASESLAVAAGATYTIKKSITLFNGDLKNSSIVVEADGVRLSNLSNVRNVTVGDSVAEGDFYLISTDVTNLVVNGGGSDSIHISGSRVNAVSVAKAQVRIVLEAASEIANLYANAVCSLDSSDSAASYLSVVVKSDVPSLTLQGSAVIEAIVTESAGTEISVASSGVDIKKAGTADTAEGAKVSVTAKAGVEVPKYKTIEKEDAKSAVQETQKAQEEIEKEVSQKTDSDDFLFKVIDNLNNNKEASGAVSYSNGEYIFKNPKVSENAADIWNYFLSAPLPAGVKKGKNYRVSVDLKSDSGGYVLLQPLDAVPMWSGNTKFVEVKSSYASYSVTTAAAGFDWSEGSLFIAVGTVENLYVKNLIVEEIEERQNYPVNVSAGCFDGYKTVSAAEDTEISTVTLTVSGIAGEIWENVYLPDTPLETGKLYKVSFNMKSSVNLDSGDIGVWGHSSDDRYETSGSNNFSFEADVARKIVLYMPVYQMKNETFRIPHISIGPKKDCSVTLSDIKAEETTVKDIQSENPGLVLYYAGEASYGSWTYNDPSEVLVPAVGGECFGDVILCERTTWDNTLQKWNGGWDSTEYAATAFRVLDSAKNDLNAVVKRYGRNNENWNSVFENISDKNCYVKFSLNDKYEVAIEKIREETPRLYIAGDIQTEK